jgi:DNA-binding MarR family transcriptional regulator
MNGLRAAAARPARGASRALAAGRDGSLPRGDKLSLDLLGAIADDHGATQRDLAARLGIALGLTNALVRRLARKGHIKIAHVSPRRVRYLLTPKGILEKSRLTYSYIQFSVGYYRDLRARLMALFDHLAASGARRVVLHGVGEVAEIALICLHGTPLELVAVVDDARAGTGLLGRPVSALDGLRHTPFDALILTLPVPPERFAERFERLGIPAAKVWGLDVARPGAGRPRRREGVHGPA